MMKEMHILIYYILFVVVAIVITSYINKKTVDKVTDNIKAGPYWDKIKQLKQLKQWKKKQNN